MKKYILSLDQGTTGSTAMIVDQESLSIIAKSNHEFPQYFPDHSWVEHDLNDILNSIKNACLDVFQESKISPDDIAAIGITNQRETTCAYKKTGEPLARAIVWQDRRTQQFCKDNADKYQPLKKKTGLPLDSYFSATKMNWLLNNNDDVRKAARDDDLCFSTIDSYLLYRLTNQKSFLTDATNASRTLLMDLASCQWDDELLSFFQIDKNFLPQIKSNITDFGKTANCDFLPDGIPILCMIGDQQSALLGQMGVKAGQMKCTYGTGAFLLLNTGSEIIPSEKGLLTTVAFKSDTQTHYALEGSTYIAGAAVQWLRDNLGVIEQSADVEKLAREVENDDIKDLYFLPFFTGLGTPHWRSEAKAAIIGMTRATNKAHLSRAVLEGIAMSVNDAFEVFQEESPYPIETLKVDGGASMNKLLMEMQADFINIPVKRPKNIETTALGAAIGCKLHLEKIGLDELVDLYQEDRIFSPLGHDYHKNKKQMWKDYIQKNF